MNALQISTRHDSITTQFLPLPTVPRGNWRVDRLLEYLSEQGFAGLPADPRMMEGYRDWLTKRGYSANSVSDCLVPLRKIYFVHGIMAAKYFLRSPERPFMHLKDAVPEGETKELLNWVDNNCPLSERVVIRLMVYLGLREIEISRIDVGDFFREDHEWKLRVWGKKRSAKDQKVKVSGGLLNVMLAFYETVKDRKYNEPMFLGQRGRTTPSTLSKLVSRIMRQAGIKRQDNDHRITPHSLRHSAVTKVLRESGNLRTAQLFARHTNMRATQVYAHDVMNDFTQFTNWEG